MAYHVVKDNTELGEAIRQLREMVTSGRPDAKCRITLKIDETEETKEVIEGPADEVYRRTLRFHRDVAQHRINKFRSDVGRLLDVFNGILPGDSIALMDSDAKHLYVSAAEILEMAAEHGGYFDDQINQLDMEVAFLTTYLKEPSPANSGQGVGKLAVLGDRRFVKDVDGTRYPPLSDCVDRSRPLADELVTILEQAYPSLLREFYPRVYESTGAYHSPKKCAAMLATVVAKTLRYGYDKSATVNRLIMPGLTYLREKRVPMFFLAPDLMTAIRATDFDDDINWQTLKLPYETGLLILPRGSFFHPKDGEISMLIWSRVRVGSHPPPYPGIPTIEATSDAFIILAFAIETCIWIDSTMTAEVRPTIRLNNLYYREAGDPRPEMIRSSDQDLPVTEEDAEFIEQCGVLVFGTIMAMNARPDLVEPARLIRKVGKKEKAKEFWSPNVIGKKYRIKREVPTINSDLAFQFNREAGTGTHASPRLHWRRGHYRDQAYGEGRRLRKQIWIEPILVGAKGAES